MAAHALPANYTRLLDSVDHARSLKSTFLAKFTIVPIPIWLELEKDRLVRPDSGYSPSAATGSFATGTDGSNRSPSASESVVNERQIEFGEMRRGEFDRLPVQDVGVRSGLAAGGSRIRTLSPA
jgi:hypothetical protein